MYFLIGGNGFLGSSFVRYFKRNKIKFKIITRDNYKSYINKKCNAVINCSTNSKKYIAEKYPEIDFKETVYNVINSIKNFKCKKYILISSGDVYGSSKIKYSKENYKFNNLNKKNSYSFNKILAERVLIKSKKPYLIFRLGGLIGSQLRKNIVFDIVNKKPLRHTMYSKLQFINTEDVAKIICDIIKKGYTNQIFNLSGDDQISIKEITQLYKKYCNKRNIKFHKNKSFIDYKLNINKIKKITNIPKTKTTMEYFFKNL